MKIVTSKQSLETMLVNMQSFLEKRDTTKITSNVYIDAKDDISTIKATDTEIGLIIKLENIIVQQEGSVTANGKRLLDIIRVLNDEEIILEQIDNNLHIKQNKSKFTLPILNPDSFPKYPKIEKKSKISLNSINLIKALKAISSSIDINNPKFELNGALLNIKNDKTQLVGTDTRRLSIFTIENFNNDELSIIIPRKAIIEIQKLFINDIDIYYDKTDIIIQNKNRYFFSRLINGKFPNYEQIIPKNLKYNITLPKKKINQAIKLITTISQNIKITFNRDSIVFNSLSNDVEAKTELMLNTNLNGFELNVNSRYLLDFMSNIESLEFQILLNEPTLPFVLKDKQFITVIMPIIV
jgi:DNA polymerase-3 subunit beta